MFNNMGGVDPAECVVVKAGKIIRIANVIHVLAGDRVEKSPSRMGERSADVEVSLDGVSAFSVG